MNFILGTCTIRFYSRCVVPCLLVPSLLSATQIFQDATTFFSQGVPTIANVIPAMDLIDEELGTKSRDMCKYESV